MPCDVQVGVSGPWTAGDPLALAAEFLHGVQLGLPRGGSSQVWERLRLGVMGRGWSVGSSGPSSVLEGRPQCPSLLEALAPEEAGASWIRTSHSHATPAGLSHLPGTLGSCLAALLGFKG